MCSMSRSAGWDPSQPAALRPRVQTSRLRPRRTLPAGASAAET
jgi:hypothetical protein